MREEQLKKKIHEQICSKRNEVFDWFNLKFKNLPHPIYSSYDIRDAGYKVTNVDANIYPAGFNNICPQDHFKCPELVAKYLKTHYEFPIKRILLVTEEHTSNSHYWENVVAINEVLEKAGYETLIGIPRVFVNPLLAQSTSGVIVEVHSAHPDSEHFKEFSPDLVISNNDFSESYSEWANMLTIPVNPPRELGWYQRKKSEYFKFYNALVKEFCELIKVDPFYLQVETEIFEGFEIGDEGSRNSLAEKVDLMIARLKRKYLELGISQEPFVFVKNNAGTYGLAVIRVGSGKEVREWNYKSRKKMKASKGGRNVEEVIIQEGIPTMVSKEGRTSEPVIYLIGDQLAGGFLRMHSEKGPEENLNSPGAVYSKLCVSDMIYGFNDCPLENVYGCVARIGLLAIALEAKSLQVEFKKYH